MSSQFTIEAPDFDRIKGETGVATRDAITSLWRVANDEADTRRTGVRAATERMQPKSIILSPSVAQNNLDTQLATVLRFDGAASVNVTGLRARPDPTIVILFVIGAGTITLKHQSASSLERNRIVTNSSGDLAIATNKCVMLIYLNTRWREMKWA